MRTIRASRRTSAIGKKRIVIASAKLERSAVARSSSDQIAIGSAVRSSRAAAAARQAAWVPAAIVRGYERSAWRARRLPGDRLGLFRALVETGPVTAAELA